MSRLGTPPVKLNKGTNPPPLWHLGYPDRGLARSRQALDLAEELAPPFTLVMVLDYAAIFHQFRHEAVMKTDAPIKSASGQGWVKNPTAPPAKPPKAPSSWSSIRVPITRPEGL